MGFNSKNIFKCAFKAVHMMRFGRACILRRVVRSHITCFITVIRKNINLDMDTVNTGIMGGGWVEGQRGEQDNIFGANATHAPLWHHHCMDTVYVIFLFQIAGVVSDRLYFLEPPTDVEASAPPPFTCI